MMMQIRNGFYILLGFGLLGQGVLRAQLLGPDGTSPITFEVDGNGLLSATGSFGTGTLSLSGAGARMIWYPGKAAFRAGYVSGSYWDDANVGAYSAAFGEDTTASGSDSLAMGYGAKASGIYAFAGGAWSIASGHDSLAFGTDVDATGSYAVALGYYTAATGADSLATGGLSFASGSYSAAFNYSTVTPALAETALGQFNLGLSSTGAAASATSWVATDPLFEIGNGTATSAPADALVVYKNGNAVLQGTLQVAPGGDIPMYTGN